MLFFYSSVSFFPAREMSRDYLHNFASKQRAGTMVVPALVRTCLLCITCPFCNSSKLPGSSLL